eukprot:3360901-Pyramimonas_sp.AAC.1
MARKTDIVHSLLSPSSITALQEVHGPAAAVEELLSRFRGGVAVFGSSGCGGVCTLTPAPLMVDIQATPFEVVVGRVPCLKLVHRRSGFCWHHWNIHNHGLDAEDFNAIWQAFQPQLDQVRHDPMKNSILMIGDFNLADEE